MQEEPTNLYRITAQSLQWIHGLTGMQYDIKYVHIVQTEHDGVTGYSFDILTNTIRLGRIKHPLGLVAEDIHIALSGQLAEIPDGNTFGPNGIANIEIEDMYTLFLKADNGGTSIVSVQNKFTLFDGGKESLSRQFLYKNNMLFQVR